MTLDIDSYFLYSAGGIRKGILLNSSFVVQNWW